MLPKTSISASADAKEKREHPRVSIAETAMRFSQT
jgi:hypothetical protein